LANDPFVLGLLTEIARLKDERAKGGKGTSEEGEKEKEKEQEKEIKKEVKKETKKETKKESLSQFGLW